MNRIALGALVTCVLTLVACAAATQKAGEPHNVPAGAERAPEAAHAAPARTTEASDAELCGDGNDEACIRLYERKGDKRPVIKQVISYFASHTTDAGRANDAGALPLDACATGDGHACAIIAVALEDAHAGDQSRRFHRLACVQGHWFSCNNLYLGHDKVGSYVLAQQSMASCDQSHDRVSCVGAAMMLKEIDAAKHVVYLGKACDLGNARSCFDYGHAARLNESDPAAFIALVKKSCAGHDPYACDLLTFPMSRHVSFCRQGDLVACAFVPGHGVDGGAPAVR